MHPTQSFRCICQLSWTHEAKLCIGMRRESQECGGECECDFGWGCVCQGGERSAARWRLLRLPLGGTCETSFFSTSRLQPPPFTLLTTTTTTTYSRQLSHLSFLFLSCSRFLVCVSFLSLGVLRFASRQVLSPTAMSSSKDPQSNIPASSKGSWSSFLKVSALLHIRIGEPCAPGRKLWKFNASPLSPLPSPQA